MKLSIYVNGEKKDVKRIYIRNNDSYTLIYENKSNKENSIHNKIHENSIYCNAISNDQ